jgi:hypothetical protein
MGSRDPSKCPVCGKSLIDRRNDQGPRAYFNCPQCGLFGLTRPTEFTLDTLLTTPRKRAVLSYGIRHTPKQGRDTTLLDVEACKKILDGDFLPTPQEQAENLVRWLGANLPGPGELVRVDFAEHGAIIGAQSPDGFHFVVKGLIDSGLLQGDHLLGPFQPSDVTLTFDGWKQFEEFRRGAPSGRKAFMAMEYGDPVLDRLVNDHFRPAVAQTGFELRRLDDDPRAGLIDDRLRVEIRSARFLIVDLTHRNAGAYWEAGYAEGLGKPVIYTCERTKFREASHFDTNHHLHVLWTLDAVDAAVKELKATIRATIPEATHE